MAEGFEALGLREELVDAAEGLDYPRPTELQAASIPVLRRGNNALLHASAGAGVVAAYGLAILDRLAGEGGAVAEGPADDVSGTAVRSLIVTPTAEAASRTAESLALLAAAAGLRVLALAPGWAPAGEVGPDIVVATPRAALEAVKGSVLKLGATRALILDGAEMLVEQTTEAIESLTAAVPADAQRILVTGDPSRVRDYVERHVRRALTIPKVEAAETEADASALLGYVVWPERRKLDELSVLLSGRGGPPPLIFCRSDERAALVAEGLSARGYVVGPAGDVEAHVAVAAASADDVDTAGHLPLSYDVPQDVQALEARHRGGGLVVVEPRELPHLRRTAARAGLRLQARREDVAAQGDEEAEEYRDRLRRAAAEEDLTSQLLLLEPLFAQLSPAEVAAAASALLRRRAAEAPSQAILGGGAEDVAGRPPAAAAHRGAPAPAMPSWTRLFMSIGNRDGVRPGDLVGAITGEARISGDRVGKVDIRDTFSLVEVPSSDAERVILALNGTTVKGRSLRVDYHRERGAGGPPRGRAPDGGRGGGRPRGPGSRGGPPSRPGGAGPRAPGGRGGGGAPRRPRGEDER